MLRYSSQDEINELSEHLIKKFCGRLYYECNTIDIERFVTEFLRYTVIYDNFATDDIGETAFLADGECSLKVWRNYKKENVIYPVNTIVLDKMYLLPKNECRKRFALAHEAGHIIMDTLVLGISARSAFNTEFYKDRFYTFEELKKILSAREYQANSMASALLMPKNILLSVMRKCTAKEKLPIYGENILAVWDKQVISDMASQMNVSYSAMYIRLKQLKLFERRSIDEYIDINFEWENLEIRTLKCPCCDFPIAGVFADAVGHFHIKCGKCKAVMVINLAYFRRIKNISKGDLEYISKKDFIK